MKRPLFAAALLLVAVIWIRLAAGDGDSPGSAASQPETGAVLYVTGQVCQKEQQKIWLQSVTIIQNGNIFQDFSDSEQNISSTESYPYEEKLICEIFGDAAEIPMGSRVAVTGTFAPFSRAANPGEFDAEVYYRSLGAGGRLRDAEILKAGGKCWPVRETAYRVKEYLRARLNRAVPAEYAGVLAALLLGDRAELDGETKDLYKRNGILHILSISSLHITIIGMGVYRLLRRAGLPIVPAAAGGAMLLVFYGSMVGFSVSACRAVGMYLLRMGAELAGRSYDMLTALGVLAAVMTLKNPFYLENSGFLLSFASVLGIGTVYPMLTESGRETPGPGYYGERKWRLWARKGATKLKEAFCASLSITLATLPVQLWYYYEVPTYSVFINLLVLPLMKPLLAAGFLSFLPGPAFAGAAASGILRVYEGACTFFDGLPFRTWNPGKPELWQIGAYYGILTAAVIWEERRRQREKEGRKGERRRGREKEKSRERKLERRRGACLKFAALSVALSILAVRSENCDRVLFLDVGQGDCCLVQTASGENYLFDCGSSSRGGVGKYVLLPCLKYYGISTLDAVFVSHPDADHMNGIAELLELAEDNRIEIKQLILPDIVMEARREEFGELLSGAGGGIRVAYLSAGESWECGTAGFTCLHPAGGYPAGNANAYSQCIYGRFEAFSLLLTGDVEGDGEAALLEALAEMDISEVTILKVAHHGSRNSTSTELLAQVRPSLAVISCGRGNRYGHPHEELLERLKQRGCIILQTAEYGAVTVQGEGNEVKVWGFRE